MASYQVLKPLKDGTPRIKITVEEGYDDKGERIRHTKTVRMKSMSERAIKKAIRDFEVEVATNYQNTKLEDVTFKAFVMDKWFPLHVKQKLALRTYQTYQNTTMNYILPYFEEMKLKKIKTIHIEEFFAHETKEGRRNLKGKYLILKSIFSRAIAWKVLASDPMDGIKEPEVAKRQRSKYYYTEDELVRLFKLLDTVYPKHRIVFKMAAILGLRRSEILGIRHHSINYDENTILIDAQLHYDKNTKKFLLGPPKSGKERTVLVPHGFIQEIKEYADDHRKLKEACGDAWTPALDDDGKPLDLLFTNLNGYPNHINSITNEWNKFLKRHDLPYVNFHGLRHSFASFMVANNVNFKIIQEQLGHSDIRHTIQTYSHLTNKDKLKEISKFDSIL